MLLELGEHPKVVQERLGHSTITTTMNNYSHVTLDTLELHELAWHDCYNEPSPPEPGDRGHLVVSRGDLAALVSAAHVAVTDFRDLRLNADALRDQP